RRMAALDLDRNEVSRTEPRTFQDLQRVCTMCNHHRRCSRDLARDSADPAWEDYCPNAATLMALNALPWRARTEGCLSFRKGSLQFESAIWRSLGCVRSIVLGALTDPRTNGVSVADRQLLLTVRHTHLRGGAPIEEPHQVAAIRVTGDDHRAELGAFHQPLIG